MVQYKIKHCALLASLDYCSDVESDGYYYFKETGKIKDYGEDLTEFADDETLDFLDSDKVIQLPTLNDLCSSDRGYTSRLAEKFIDEKVTDENTKKDLLKAYKSLFSNKKLSAFAGSPKFTKKLREIGMFELWQRFLTEDYDKHADAFLQKWCTENGVEIIYDDTDKA